MSEENVIGEYICKDCKRKFIDNGALLRHMGWSKKRGSCSVGKLNRQRPYICRLGCEREFKLLRGVTSHERWSKQLGGCVNIGSSSRKLSDEEKTIVLDLHRKEYPISKIARLLKRSSKIVSNFCVSKGLDVSRERGQRLRTTSHEVIDQAVKKVEKLIKLLRDNGPMIHGNLVKMGFSASFLQEAVIILQGEIDEIERSRGYPNWYDSQQGYPHWFGSSVFAKNRSKVIYSIKPIEMIKVEKLIENKRAKKIENKRAKKIEKIEKIENKRMERLKGIENKRMERLKGIENKRIEKLKRLIELEDEKIKRLIELEELERETTGIKLIPLEKLKTEFIPLSELYETRILLVMKHLGGEVTVSDINYNLDIRKDIVYNYLSVMFLTGLVNRISRGKYIISKLGESKLLDSE